MALITLQEAKDFCNLGGAGDDPNSILQSIIDSADEFVSSYCHRTFESTAYTLERYNGEGKEYICLNNYPIISVDRVAIGTRDVMKICNTSAGTTASVSVLSTGLRLVKDGTADSTITWASYATMTLVVAAINALGDGWSASISSSDYDSFKSSELIERYGSNVIDSNWVYLEMPEDAEDDIEVWTDRGQIRRLGGFPSGCRNVIIDYTAGYATIPEDLKLAVKILTQVVYQKAEEQSFGVKNYEVERIKAMFEEKDIPKEAISILNRYRRFLV